jgi:hypothetical protein
VPCADAAKQASSKSTQATLARDGRVSADITARNGGRRAARALTKKLHQLSYQDP